jgi:MMP 1-O-methyltransferase
MTINEVQRVAASIEGWLAPREVEFLYRTATSCSRGVILEIGSFKGKSTVCLGLGSRAGSEVPVYAVDPHIGSIEQQTTMKGRSSFKEFQTNVRRANLQDLVVPIVRKSADVARDWERPIGFLWIDGDHSYQGAKLDFEAFSPWVVDGGVIGFHDSTEGGVPRVVREAFTADQFSHIGLVDSISCAIKSKGLAKKTIRDKAILLWMANYSRFRKVPTPIKAAVKEPIKGLVAVLSGGIHVNSH